MRLINLPKFRLSKPFAILTTARYCLLTLAIGLGAPQCAFAALDVSISLSSGYPNPIYPGDVTSFHITLTNSNATSTVTGVAFTDTMPGTIVVAGAGLTAYTCTDGTGSPVPPSGAVTAMLGASTIGLSGAIVPVAVGGGASGECDMDVEVTSTANNSVQTNTIPVGAVTGVDTGAVSNGSQAQQSITINNLNPPVISKSFSRTTVVKTDQTVRLTITIDNSSNPTKNLPLNTGSDTPAWAIHDVLPAGLQVAATPNVVITCAGGSTPTFSPAAAATTLVATGGTVAAGGVCTLAVDLVGTTTAGVYSNSLTNTIDRNADFGDERGLAPATNATASLSIVSALQVSKVFSPGTISAGQAATLTITLTNASPLSTLTLTSFTDNPIDGVGNPGYGLKVNSVSTTCSGATAAATGGNTGITLTGGSIAANGNCTITVTYTGTLQTPGTPQSFTNTIAAGAVGTSDASIVSQPATHSVTVVDQLTVSKSGNTNSASPGNPVQYAVTVSNYSASALTNVVIVDPLPSGMFALPSSPAAPILSGAGCSGLTTDIPALPASDGTPHFTITTVPAGVGPSPSQCTVTFWAMTPIGAAVGANLNNTIASGGVTGNDGGPTISNAGSSNSVGVTVASTVTVSKLFNPSSSFEGTVSQLTVTFTSLSAQVLTNAGFTDNLPIGSTGLQLVIANPANASSTCSGATITATPGASSVTMSGATIPARAGNGSGANGTCTLRVNVIGAAGNYTNTLPVGALTATETYGDGTTHTASSPGPVSAGISYASALTAGKLFSPTVINSGGKSTVTVQLGNVGTGTLNSVGVTDPLPAGMVVANPANAYTTCGGGAAIAATSGASSAAMTGAVIPGSGHCNFLFDVTATGVGNWINTIPIGNITAAGGVQNVAPVTATLTNSTAGGVIVTNNATPNSLTAPGQVSVLTITLNNSGTVALTGMSLTDYFTTTGGSGALATGMVIAGSPNGATTCAGGIVSAVAGGASISLTGASLAVSASCTVTVNVTLNTTGTVQDTIPVGAIVNSQGITNSTLTVTSLSASANIGISKLFNPAVIKPGDRSTLVLTFINPVALSVSNLAAVDNLPVGVTIPVGANPSTTCVGATVSSTSGQMTISGGSLPAAVGGVASTCTAQIDVTAAAVGTYNNLIAVGGVTGSIGSGPVNNPVSAPATLQVRNPVTIVKAFGPNTVSLGTPTTLTITLTNSNSIALTGAVLTDNLPGNVTVALTPSASTTCAGGSVAAAPSATAIVLTGATLPASGSCTVTVNVLSNIAGIYLNTIPAGNVTTLQGVTNTNPTSDTLTVQNPPTVSKQFNPTSIPVGGTSALTIVLGNTNGSAATLSSTLTDTLPTSPGNIIVATPNGLGGTCTLGSVTAVAGSGTVSYASGASIPAGGCTIIVNVTGSLNGVYNNNIPVGALQTSLGNNIQPANANLVISPLGYISGRVFNDNNVTPNGIYGGTDTPIAGVTINLTGTDYGASGVAGGGTSSPFSATTITDVLGNYSFTGLDPGSYTVTEPSQPAGTLNGITSAGTVSGGGGGSVGAATVQAVTPSAVSGIILLKSGGAVASSPNNNFAEVLPSSISGTVFLDQNNDGIQNVGDTGLVGVAIQLLNGSNATIASTTTDSNGNFSFTGLAPGTYSVREPVQPAATANGKTTAGAVTNGGTAGTPTAQTVIPSVISGVILPPNTAVTGNNFAEVPAVRQISGRLFVDIYSDGTFHGSDYGIGGFTLNLAGTDLNSMPVSQSVITGADGRYVFSGLAEGTYSVTEPSQPAGTNNGITTAGNTGGTATAVTVLPSSITSINLTGTNTISSNNNFAEVPAPINGGSISGSIYVDANNNGVFDSGEVGIAGVTVQLSGVDIGGNAINLSTLSMGNGSYIFLNLTPSNAGGYTVTETQPAAYLDGKTTIAVGNPGLAASVKPVAAGNPDTITKIFLGTNVNLGNYNFGEQTSSTVSGYVYVDANNNGVRDVGESGIAGVAITLTGVDTNGAQINLTTSTAADGSYSFSKLLPSNAAGYKITETQPSAYLDGKTTIPSGSPGAASSAKPVAAGGGDVISTIVITNGVTLTEYDFGEQSSNMISGYVYADANNNGVKDAGESGIAGVAITLTGVDTNGAPVNLTMSTAADGSYSFSKLLPSNAAGYKITETQPSAYLDGKTTVPTGSPGTASSAKPVAAGGADVITAIVLTNGGNLVGYDFGEQAGTTISGYAYVDANNNGVRDAGESGIAAVTVTLTGVDTNGAPVNLTTSTAADGSYSFSKLLPSNAAGYKITETQPSAYPDGKTTIPSGSPGTASSAKPVAAGGADVISSIVLTNGGNLVEYDFGEQLTSTISGFVYADANNNGIREAGESGIAAVTVTLTGVDMNGAPVNLTTSTATDGSYSFSKLLPSNSVGYAITETQPSNYLDGKTTVPAGSPGSPVSVKPVAAGAADVISNILLPGGVTLTEYDFGEQISSTISGFVYIDANNDGLKESGETGIAGVGVKLTGNDMKGAPVNQTVLSGPDGSFVFTNLAGSDSNGYTLTETQPGGYTDGKTTVASGSPGTPVSGKPVLSGNNDAIGGIKLVAGNNLTGYLFGELAIPLLKPPIVNGYVWLDINHSRIRPLDGSQLGQAGWTVQLKQNGTLICTTLTDSSGFYQFDNLHCAGYESSGLPIGSGFSIIFNLNGNNLPNVPISGDGRGVVSPTGGQITNITLNSSDTVVEQNLPLDPSGIVYDSVTRKPVAGATVTITGPAGFDPATQLVGSSAAQRQVVGADGLYQFLLQNGFPSGVYTLAIGSPQGYLPAPSTSLPVCSATASVGLLPSPALVQASNGAPSLAVTPQLNPAACVGIVAGGALTTQYYLSFFITNGGSAPIVNNNIPLDPLPVGGLLVTKTTQMVNVAIGGMVPYTITVANTQNFAMNGVDVHDQMPPGFKYRTGSGTRNGIATVPLVSARALDWANQNFAPLEKKTFSLILIVGTGVADGDYTNQAWAANGATNAQISNLATATVRIVPDPTFDCPDIIGKVFDDKNANGYQDQGEPGIPGVRLATARGLLVTTDAEGRFHVPCPAIPNADHGSNFVMKLDDRTLPSGYRLTTENPRDVRITSGKLVKLNFGATIHRVVRVELADAAFEPGTEKLLPEWEQQMKGLQAQLKLRPSLVRIAYARGQETPELAAKRIAVLRDDIQRRWKEQKGSYNLVIETESAQ